MYHIAVKYCSRRKGQSAGAVASYRSGQRLEDHYYGEVHDFTNKGGIVHSWIQLPLNAPLEYFNRETLWNAVEHAEKRRDARLAREVEGALPKELKLDEHIRIVEEYVASNFVGDGMCADISIHDNGNGNPHFHCLLTTRNVSEDGFGNKNREWNKREHLERWRREWAKIQNRELEQRGLEPVSHECYAVQDFGCAIERTPTIHRGRQAQKLDRVGIETDRMKEYREIVEHNRNLERELQQKRECQRNRGRGR
jgi:ATP-dependent exoDNAse (exonuclease V), alpha subunit - helicase superfamily I member